MKTFSRNNHRVRMRSQFTGICVSAWWNGSFEILVPDTTVKKTFLLGLQEEEHVLLEKKSRGEPYFVKRKRTKNLLIKECKLISLGVTTYATETNHIGNILANSYHIFYLLLNQKTCCSKTINANGPAMETSQFTIPKHPFSKNFRQI